MTAGWMPCAMRRPATKRDVGLLPAPVRVARTEITGTSARDGGAVGPQQREVGPGRQHPRGLMHDELVRHVAVREHHLVARPASRMSVSRVLSGTMGMPSG